jgi:hypothetical protein
LATIFLLKADTNDLLDEDCETPHLPPMKPPYRIETESKTPLLVHSIDEVDSTLEELQQQYLTKGPTSVVITEAEKDFELTDQIGLGLGIDPTFVLIQIAPCDGEYYFAVGDELAKGSVEFFGAGEFIVVERRNFIPWPLVRQVVQEFLEHNRRTTLVRWEDCFGHEA